MEPSANRARGGRGAFSLIEVLVALGIASFALVTLLGLVLVGAQHNQETTEESLTNNLLAALVADVRSTPTNQPSAVFRVTPHPDAVTRPVASTYWIGADGLPVPDAAKARYRVDIRMYPPDAGAQGTLSAPSAWFRISWPAQAEKERIVGSAETFQVFPVQP